MSTADESTSGGTVGEMLRRWALNARQSVAALGARQAEAHVIAKVREADPTLYGALKKLADETTFTVRHYGRGHFFVWSHHPNFGGHDPWPAARFPRACVCWDHLMGVCDRLQGPALPA